MKTTRKYDDRLKIIENKRSAKGGVIVVGYLEEKDDDGKLIRIRKTFSGPHHLERAQAFKDEQLKTQERLSEEDMKARVSKFSPSEEAVILSLVDDLREDADAEDSHLTPDKLLKQAVTYYLTSPYRGMIEKLVAAASEEYQNRRDFLENSKSHRDGVKSTLDAFCALHGNQLISSVTKQQVEAFLERRGPGVAAAGTRKVEKAHLNALFNWAFKSDYVAKNVVSKTDKIKVKRAEPVSLSIDQVKEIFVCANQVDNGSLIPYFALAIFAALRPYEVRRAQWEDFNWEEGTIDARQEKGNGYDRTVKLPEICLEWLRFVDGSKRTGDLCPKNFIKQFNVVRAAAGFRVAEGSIRSTAWFGLDDKIKGCGSKKRPDWVHDVCRHTGISYRLKIVQDHQKVGWWSGNSKEIIRTHYQSVRGITQATTDEFFNITPESLGLEAA